MTYTQLSKHAGKLPKGYALYGLKHVPTGALYIGSTTDLPSRLMNWYYALGNADTPLPSRVQKLAEIYGREPHDWAYSIIDHDMPVGYKPRVPLERKPEWPLVQWMAAKSPQLLLNDKTGRGGRPAGDKPGWGPMGVSPLKYLNVMLGIHRGVKWPSQPPCNRPIDTRSLTPTGEMANVRFAAVLQRAMNRQPRHLNPSAAAIDELYQLWRKEQLAGFAEDAGLPGTITTAGAAFALADPAVWYAGHAARSNSGE